jgi:hypothetical protein
MREGHVARSSAGNDCQRRQSSRALCEKGAMLCDDSERILGRNERRKPSLLEKCGWLRDQLPTPVEHTLIHFRRPATHSP